MNVKEIKKEGLTHELEVTVPANDIDTKIVEKLQQVGKSVKQSGFRPGKMPLDMLRKKYGKAVLGEVLEIAVNDATRQVLEQKKLRPAMQPKIEVKTFDEGKDLVFQMVLDVLPDFTVMNTKGIKIEKPVAKIEDKDITETLERIAGQHKATKKIESDRAAKKGDFVVMDFHGRTKDDNVEHQGMHAHGHKLELGSGQFIPGFEDQLVGKKAGDKVEVEVTFPKEYHAKNLAGRVAIFDVVIHEIHEAAKTEINEAFAKDMGFDDEKSLREAVKNQLQSDYAQQTRLKMKRQLLDIMDDAHDFEIPKGMYEAELDQITKQIEMERKNDPEAKDLTAEEKEELETIAERRVRLGLVIAEIGQQEKVTISNQELQRAVIGEAQKYPGQEKMVFEFYQKNPRMLENLRAPMFEEKVVDILFDRAEIKETEVSIEDLMKDEDEEDQGKEKAKKKPAAKKSSKKAE